MTNARVCLKTGNVPGSPVCPAKKPPAPNGTRGGGQPRFHSHFSLNPAGDGGQAGGRPHPPRSRLHFAQASVGPLSAGGGPSLNRRGLRYFQRLFWGGFPANHAAGRSSRYSFANYLTTTGKRCQGSSAADPGGPRPCSFEILRFSLVNLRLFCPLILFFHWRSCIINKIPPSPAADSSSTPAGAPAGARTGPFSRFIRIVFRHPPRSGGGRGTGSPVKLRRSTRCCKCRSLPSAPKGGHWRKLREGRDARRRRARRAPQCTSQKTAVRIRMPRGFGISDL